MAHSIVAPFTLELGGKSPNIVFDDANLDMAEAGVLSGIFAAAGQMCVAGSRAHIHENIYDELVARLVRRAENIRIGDPMLADTQMGPVATAMQLAKDEGMVARALEQGAELLTGGKRARVSGFEHGYFFQPTIIHKAGVSDLLMHNEVFGPVLAVAPFKDMDEVVRLANNTAFGLASGAWTNDLRRAHSMARTLKSGTVWINTYRALAFIPRLAGTRIAVSVARTASKPFTSICRPRASGASWELRSKTRLSSRRTAAGDRGEEVHR